MKKVLVAFAVVSVFAASCNENNTSSTEVKKTDTPAVTPAPKDTTVAPKDTTAAPKDTTAAPKDTASKK
jgi:hypothetical protein